MLNYIKMDFLKSVKSNMLIFATIFFVLLNGLTIYEIKDQLKYSSENSSRTGSAGIMVSMEDKEEDMKMNLGMHVDTADAVRNKGSLLSCVETLYNGGFLVFIVTLVAIVLICNDFSTGFIKNTITIPKHRWYANVSKIANTFIIFLIENLIGILMFIITIKFTDFFGDAKIGNVENILIYIAVQAVLVMGITSVMIFLANLTRSKVITILISMFMIFGVFEVFLYVFAKGALGANANVMMKYLIIHRSLSITASDSMNVHLKTIGLGIVWLVIFMVLANIVISKKDV